MGLDMFLSVSRYQDKNEYNRDDNGKMQSKVLPEFVQLIKKSGLSQFQNDHTYGIKLEMVAMYWRKANAIHSWFVENLAGGEDNCKPMYVSTEHLQELLTTCKTVLEYHTEEKALELLPPTSGFFFGSMDIDEWYWQDLQYTVTELEKVLDKVGDSHEFSFMYEASW
jgi:hypothetical protein